MNKENNKSFDAMFKQIKSSFDRCFWLGDDCSAKAIRAHSIQNSIVLDLICEDDHVIMPKMEIDRNTGASLNFKKIGRNKATTFTGLCDEHDSQLFAPIDKYFFDPKNDEQLFLIAYRSVLRELHAKMKAAVDLQSQYTRGVEMGKFNPDVIDYPMIQATTAIAESYSFDLYKFKFDQIYNKGEYDQVSHRIEFVENIEPSIAVSATYSYIDNMRTPQDRYDAKCISLNVFPCNNGIFFIFSYIKDHEKNMSQYLDRIFQAERHYKLYLISKLVLMYCENFVISPKFYRSIPEPDRTSIADYFKANLLVDKRDSENATLYLFN